MTDDPAKPLTRIEAAAYLVTKGVNVSPVTLAKYAVDESGPKYSKDQNKAMYLPADLDAWVAARPSRNPRPAARPARAKKAGAGPNGNDQLPAAVREYMTLVDRVIDGSATFRDGVEYQDCRAKLQELLMKL